MEELTGRIKEVVYYANGFGVIKFEYGKTSRTAAGKMPRPCQGDLIRMEGTWGKHPKYGRQFQTTWAQIQAEEVEPENLLVYLKSGFLYGVGPALGQRIYEAFGDRAVEIIEQEPEKLCTLSGITKAKSEKIRDSYEKTKKYIPLAIYLRSATRYQIETI